MSGACLSLPETGKGSCGWNTKNFLLGPTPETVNTGIEEIRSAIGTEIEPGRGTAIDLVPLLDHDLEDIAA